MKLFARCEKMNLYKKDLSIVQKFIQTYKLWYEFLPHFPKTSRYTLGSKIDSLFMETIELIIEASCLNRQGKSTCLKRASIKLDLLKFFLQLSWEIRALDNKKYILLSEKLDEVGKMLGGWIKQLSKETPPESGE